MQDRIPSNDEYKAEFESGMAYLRKPVTLLGYSDTTEITSIAQIRQQLQRDIEEVGWPNIRKNFAKAVRNVFGTQWYAENLFLLRVFQIQEYLGYEGCVLESIKKVKTGACINEITEQIVGLLISKLSTQIQNGGNTIFLDVDKLSTGKSAVLIPLILEKRYENFILAMIQFHEADNLDEAYSHIFATQYGFSITQAMNLKEKVKSNLLKIKNHLGILYEELMKDGSLQIISSSTRPSTPIQKLCIEIAIENLIGYVAEFAMPIDRFKTLYQSGYRDVIQYFTNQVLFFPGFGLSEMNYNFLKDVLPGIKTKRSSVALKLLGTTYLEIKRCT